MNDGEVVAEYIEMEWGKRPAWPKLAEAIAHAQEVQGTLVVAKLDRLVRNRAFTGSLDKSGVDFVCCDNPLANPATIHILAAVADDETKRISAHTKAGLIAAKERGVKLGSAREGHWEGREDRRREGCPQRIAGGGPGSGQGPHGEGARSVQRAFASHRRDARRRAPDTRRDRQTAQCGRPPHQGRPAVYGHDDTPPAQARGHDQSATHGPAPGAAG